MQQWQVPADVGLLVAAVMRRTFCCAACMRRLDAAQPELAWTHGGKHQSAGGVLHAAACEHGVDASWCCVCACSDASTCQLVQGGLKWGDRPSIAGTASTCGCCAVV